MTIVMRADAGTTIGNGHVMRCAALAERAALHGHSAHLIAADVPADLEAWLVERGIAVERIRKGSADEDAALTAAFTESLVIGDWLIVDHYALDRAWEKAVPRGGAKLLVIDDLADRAHECDVLLDTGLHVVDGNPYAGLVQDSAELLFGPSFAQLRGEFDLVKARERSGDIARVLVYLGGGRAAEDELVKVAEALASCAPDGVEVAFLAGPEQLQGIDHLIASRHGFAGVVPVADMPALLDWADLVVGACGISSWERCLLAVPALVAVMEPNQAADARLLDETGAVVNLGPSSSLDVQDWIDALSRLWADPMHVRAMSAAASRVMDGRTQALLRLERLFDADA